MLQRVVDSTIFVSFAWQGFFVISLANFGSNTRRQNFRGESTMPNSNWPASLLLFIDNFHSTLYGIMSSGSSSSDVFRSWAADGIWAGAFFAVSGNSLRLGLLLHLGVIWMSCLYNLKVLSRDH